ncbi:tyrosine-type recombinase/integrase [Enterococcus bulliens]
MATFKQYETKQGKKWLFKVYLGIDAATGKRIETTRRNFPTKKAAQLELSRLQVEFDRGEYGKKKQPEQTFQEVFKLWQENYEYTVKESTYVKAISQYKVHILPVFGHKTLSNISISDVQQFANQKVKTFVKYRDLISDISRVFEYAITLGLVKDNPVKRIVIPKRKIDVQKETRMNYYTKEELKTFLDCTKKQQPFYIYTFFQLLVASGCRQGELLGLEWRSVDFKNKCIHIKQTLARGKNRRLYLEQPKTTHSKRSISLDDVTIAALKQWKKEQRAVMLQLGHNTLNDTQLVFSNEQNTFLQLSKPRKWLLQTINKNNLREITIHGFRHTSATLLLEHGVQTKVISERLGHSSITITNDIYLNVTEKMEKEVPNVFAKIMEN